MGQEGDIASSVSQFVRHLDAEKQVLIARIQKIDEAKRAALSVPTRLNGDEATGTNPAPASTQAFTVEPHGSTHTTQARVLEQAAKKNGDQLTIIEARDVLRQRGLLHSADEAMAVRTAISRGGKFEHAGPGRYRLKGSDRKSQKRRYTGVLHQNEHDVLGLLRNTVMSLEEIGENVGVSRQRIKQIAAAHGIDCRKRQVQRSRERYAAAAAHSEKQWRLEHEGICEAANARRLEMKFLDHNTAIINGYRCGLRAHIPYTAEGQRYSRMAMISDRRATKLDFVLQPIDTGVLVMPIDKFPRGGTIITADPKRPESSLTTSFRHDYPKYLDAWGQLATPKEGVSGAGPAA